MKVRGLRELRRAGRWVRGRFTAGGLVLLYHRVAADSPDPFGICVSPDNFAAQMGWLRQNATPLSLTALLDAARSGALPRRAVAVTFDDGYADNLHCALPILAEEQLPATVFVTTGAPGVPFWWDRLTDIIYHATQQPAGLTVNHRPDWHKTVFVDDWADRALIVRSLHGMVQPWDTASQDRVLAQLAEQTGAAPSPPPLARALTTDERRALAAHELITIGAHTVTHPRLADCPLEMQWAEISRSRAALVEALGTPVSTFAYPFGQPDDYTRQTRQFLAKAGFDVACTTTIGSVWRRSDPLRLPRLWARDETAVAFGARLQKWWR